MSDRSASIEKKQEYQPLNQIELSMVDGVLIDDKVVDLGIIMTVKKIRFGTETIYEEIIPESIGFVEDK